MTEQKALGGSEDSLSTEDMEPIRELNEFLPSLVEFSGLLPNHTPMNGKPPVHTPLGYDPVFLGYEVVICPNSHVIQQWRGA